MGDAKVTTLRTEKPIEDGERAGVWVLWSESTLPPDVGDDDLVGFKW